MLTIERVAASYGTGQILFGVSLSICEGEVVTLLGRNGMGKTTTVRVVMGLLPILHGSVMFFQRAIHHLEPYQIARRGISLVPEGRQVFPNLTVKENLVATATNRIRAKNPWTLNRIYSMFPELESRERLMASQLSGGEQQMLAVSRALMTNPKLLILDEATEGLSPLARKKIWECIEVLRTEGLSLLVIDKNVFDLAKVADRHYILEKGQIVWHGDSTALKLETHIHARYLGVSLQFPGP